VDVVAGTNVAKCLVTQGTVFFTIGVGLVVWGWAIVGMLVETYGFWLLFAGFVPTALSFLRRLPILGRMLDLPIFKKVSKASKSAFLYMKVMEL
jgi:hypothetical protein